jgi:hypothetical protein
MNARLRVRVALAAAASTVAVGALAAPAAQANLLSLDPSACGTQPTSQPFRKWLDLSSYALVPGGSFEAGGAAWTLSGGAAVKAGNESFYVHGASDKSSLVLPPGSSATSPAVCASIYRPTLRFFARNTGSLLSSLRVDVLTTGLGGVVSVIPLGVVAGSSWAPTLPLPILANLVSVLPGSSTSLAFRFTPVGTGGSWSIDDVYIDPYARR